MSTHKCPGCERDLVPEGQWHGANFCRGLFLMDSIAENPGQSAWELSKSTGLSYAQCAKGLAKIRAQDAIGYEPEDRDGGGIRYRFYPLPDHANQVGRITEMAHSLARAW
jgi:hypothetical protein